MNYRKLGKSDLMISELSIGVLRLEDAVLGQSETRDNARTRAIQYAIDMGINHINLGFPLYFSDPESACEFVRKALDGAYREKVKVAVNISSRHVESHADLDNALDEQLRLFKLEKADFCIIDGVYRATWTKLKELDITSWLEKTISSGKADYVGMSFHDDAYYLSEIYNTYADWTPMQFEFSPLDYKHHPGAGGFKFTEEHGGGVIATDITKGGRLLKNIPQNIQELWDASGAGKTAEEYCVRWALSFSEVSSALVNFGSVEEVCAYLAYIDNYHIGDADIWEVLQATKVREAYYANRAYQCTSCRCCMPCNFGVDVPRIIELINDEKMFSDSSIPMLQYNLEKQQDIKCAECGACNTQCPKRFPLQGIVSEAYEKYANTKSAGASQTV